MHSTWISNCFRMYFTRGKIIRSQSCRYHRIKHSRKKLLCSIRSSLVIVLSIFLHTCMDNFMGDFNCPRYTVSDGEAYCLGSVDTDCWYLYTLNREKSVDEPSEPDQTLEILMTHLDPEVMAIFTRDVCSSADEATQKSGIDKLISNMIIDDFLFEPCGYSMNGVSKSVSILYGDVRL